MEDTDSVDLHVNWQRENVVESFGNYRIIQVVAYSPYAQWRCVFQLIGDGQTPGSTPTCNVDTHTDKAYLCINKDTVVGCVIAQPISEAHEFISKGNQYEYSITTKIYPVKCGIYFLWVSDDYRRKKLATYMLDTVRECFIPDQQLAKKDLAICTPTKEGRIFSKKYFKRENFFVYM